MHKKISSGKQNVITGDGSAKSYVNYFYDKIEDLINIKRLVVKGIMLKYDPCGCCVRSKILRFERHKNDTTSESKLFYFTIFY